MGRRDFVKDFVAVEVGDRDLGGGDQPVVVVLELAAGGGFGIGIGAAEEVFSELGQLAGAEEGLGIDHERRQDFRVAVLLRCASRA